MSLKTDLRSNIFFAFLVALSAAMLALAGPPANISAAAWVALVPLAVALRNPITRYRLLILWIGGLGYGLSMFFYVRHVTTLGTAGLALYISFYFVAFAALVRWASFVRRMPLALSMPLFWAALEHLRGFLLTGLPWGFLAHTQYMNLKFIQIADFAGAAGVTFWIGAVNGSLADILMWRFGKSNRGRWEIAVSAACVLVLSAFAIGYGEYRMSTIIIEEGPVTALVQGNIPQDLKNRLTRENIIEIFSRHVYLSNGAMRSAPRPEIIIWPETMAPFGVLDEQYRNPSNIFLQPLLQLQRNADLLVSAVSNPLADDKTFHNSIFFLPRGKLGPTARYDKIHIVPFGEYVPLKPLIGKILAPIIPYDDGLTAGTNYTLFESSGWTFAPTVCYEDGFAGLVRRFNRHGRKIDCIVNVTNEGWFKDGIELDQHLAIGVFRAIENRAGLVRAANTGISAFVSPLGAITAKKDREVRGFLVSKVTRTSTMAPFVYAGELFGWLVFSCASAWIILFGMRDILSARSERALLRK